MQKYHLSIEDYYDLAAIGLCKAGSTFNENKSKFSTYAYKCMFTTVAHEFRKKNQTKVIPDYKIVYYQAELDESNGGDTASFINYIPSKEDVENNALSQIIFEEYATGLKDRDKKIFILSQEGYKQKEISKILGCSQSLISRAKKRLEEYLVN